MPRTKASTRKIKTEKVSLMPQDDKSEKQIKILEGILKERKAQIESILTDIDKELMSYPPETHNMTHREIEEKRLLSISTLSNSSHTKGQKSRSRSVQRNNSRSVMQNRSLSRTANSCKTDNKKFVTPTHSRAPPMFAQVTPKINPGMPIVLLRKPNLGENVISMQGSPLLVQTSSNDQEACIHVPLPTGQVFAIRSQLGDLSNVPKLDENVRKQLLTLERNLVKVLQKH